MRALFGLAALWLGAAQPRRRLWAIPPVRRPGCAAAPGPGARAGELGRTGAAIGDHLRHQPLRHHQRRARHARWKDRGGAARQGVGGRGRAADRRFPPHAEAVPGRAQARSRCGGWTQRKSREPPAADEQEGGDWMRRILLNGWLLVLAAGCSQPPVKPDLSPAINELDQAIASKAVVRATRCGEPGAAAADRGRDAEGRRQARRAALRPVGEQRGCLRGVHGHRVGHPLQHDRASEHQGARCR